MKAEPAEANDLEWNMEFLEQAQIAFRSIRDIGFSDAVIHQIGFDRTRRLVIQPYQGISIVADANSTVYRSFNIFRPGFLPLTTQFELFFRDPIICRSSSNPPIEDI